nr:reverse transcriptase domain-containing protein [Tanacetum cinerariifolium]
MQQSRDDIDVEGAQIKVINSLAVQTPPSYSSITIEAWSCQYCTISGAIRGIVTISLVKPSSAFVEANYEVLKSLLRDHIRHLHNEDLQLNWITTMRKLEEALNKSGSRAERESNGRRPSERRAEEGGIRGVHGPRTGPNHTRTARTKNYKLGKRETENRHKFFGSVLGWFRFWYKNFCSGTVLRRFQNGSSVLMVPRFFWTPLGGIHRGNLLPLLATQLGRSEYGQPLQSTLTSKYKGNQPLTNLGGNLSPNGSNNSSDPVIIRVQISKRQVNRVYMDRGSSCEVVYENCFLKLKPSIRLIRVDSKTSLVRFSREHSWPLGEVPLEVTVGESPYTSTETLSFVIVRSNSPYNIFLEKNICKK